MSNRPSKKPMPSQKVYEARDQTRRSQAIWIIAGVVSVVVFALIVTFAVTSSGGSDTTDNAGQEKGSAGTVVPKGTMDYGTVSVEGTPLPPLAQGGTDAAIGKPVPVVTGQQFDGSPITIGGPSANGKPTVVIGVAHWCPHCQREVPSVESWLEDHGMPDDVNLVALSAAAVEERGNWPARAWLAREGWTVPTMVDDEAGAAATATGLAGFPYYLIYDKDGTVIWRGSGERLTPAQIVPLFDAARSGQPPSS